MANSSETSLYRLAIKEMTEEGSLSHNLQNFLRDHGSELPVEILSLMIATHTIVSTLIIQGHKFTVGEMVQYIKPILTALHQMEVEAVSTQFE